MRLTAFPLYVGREYGMAFRRHWYYGGEDTLKVRVVRLRLEDDRIEVKVLETRKPVSPWDEVPVIGTHIDARPRQIVCEWENIEQYKQEQRQERNSRPKGWGTRFAGKRKWRKSRTMSKPGARSWESHTKEHRKDANRRDRHRTKQELHP